jgi:hypothetical protein
MMNAFMMNAFIMILLVAYSVLGQSKADFLIISNPADYTIANQYQQTMSDAEKREKLANAPLRVENPDQISGDQISHVAKCVYNGENYFLLKNDEGKFAGEKESGQKTFQNCAVIEDTVVVTIGGRIKIISPAGRTHLPGSGIIVVRFFKSGARYYVRAIDEKPVFGWSTMEPENAWRKTEKVVVREHRGDSLFPGIYRKRVEEKIAAANEAYNACFGHFNARTSDQKSVPYWRCENSSAGMRCEISEGWKKGDQLSGSTDALVQELENVLLGSGFGVSVDNGVMVIKKRIKDNP